MSATNPGIARKWVFPIIRILIFAAVAAALIKLAFVGGIAAESDPATATGQITDPQVEITTGTIHNDVVMDATVSADPAVPVRATLAGGLTPAALPTEGITTFGASFFVTPDIVLKADYQWFSVDSDNNRFQLGLGVNF